MEIQLYPKQQILLVWEQLSERYSHEPGQPLRCLRCNDPLDKELAHNALSRSLDVYVCSKCGSDDAMRDYAGRALPLWEWHVVKSGQLVHSESADAIVLTPVNAFQHIFEGPKK